MTFNAALSGIQASSASLDVIGNNIANSATVGFKSSRAQFQDIYSYGNYRGGSNNIGGGVRLSGVQQSFANGNIYATSNVLDLAVDGPGFFILSDQGSTVYSRAGQFTTDNQNFIVNSSNINVFRAY